MSKFGWSLPAGCEALPGEEDAGQCHICQGDVDSGQCNCPECEVCGVTGDPDCINTHMSWQKFPALCGLTPAVMDERKRETLRIEQEMKDEEEARKYFDNSPLS